MIADEASEATREQAAIDLYWIPLGSGAWVVRHCGRAFEALTARVQHRVPCDLYHSALVVTVDGVRTVIEMTPVPDRRGDERGTVVHGAVGLRWAGRLRLFRYEVRRWRHGVLPDEAAAAGGPVPLTSDAAAARRLLALVPSVPGPVWGRDELGAGEMWNSNSVTSFLLARTGLDADAVALPAGGRAPGWDAGRIVAALAPHPAIRVG